MYTKAKVGLKQLIQRASAWIPKDPYLLPTKYESLKVMGEGSFGKVLRCLDRDTGNVVAIKMPRFKQSCRQEVAILERLMDLKLDEHSIVKYHESFTVRRGEALVFESLKLSIENYLIKDSFMWADIRNIIEQVATALNALKSIGVIHTDIKPNNIMLVDQKRPFRVKLIDFGLAMDKSKARQGMFLQTGYFRSPEIILGLPFSEAIDMWSLGCVLFTMLFREMLFTANGHHTLWLLVKLLGQPPDELLNRGRWTEDFFIRNTSNSWRIKTPLEECWIIKPLLSRRLGFSSLDDLKKCSIFYKAKESYEQCIELMKAMLKMDQNERITPTEVLQHPFITHVYTKDKDTKDNKDIEDTRDNEDTKDEDTEDNKDTEDNEDIEDNEDTKDNEDNETPSNRDDDSREEKKKKKKNCFQRFRSWCKKKFFCNQVGVIVYTKDTKDNEDTKDNKDIEDNEDTKDNEDPKDSKDTKDNEDTKDNKDNETPSNRDEDSKEEKKKKKCFQRFRSWCKKKFFCNRVGVM